MLIATITLDEKDVNVMTAFASFMEELSDIAIVQEFLDFTGIDGDVAGPQPSETDMLYSELIEAGFSPVQIDDDFAIFAGSGDEDNPLDAEVRAHVEGDLNGDGMVDEKDEAIRLAQLADDGNPHVGE